MPSPVAGQVTGSARPDEEALAVQIAFWDAAKDIQIPLNLTRISSATLKGSL